MALTFRDIQDLPFYKKFLILILILAVLFGLFYYFIYLPKTEEVASLKAQLRKLDQQLVQKRKLVRNIEQFRKEFALLKKKLDESLRQLPNKEMIDMILMDIAKFERKENLESILFKPKKEIKRDFYAIVPVQIQIRGTYHQIGKFFEDIINLPRIVNVKGYKFTKPKDMEGIILLTADCAVETYRYIPESERAPKKKTGRKKNAKKKK